MKSTRNRSFAQVVGVPQLVHGGCCMMFSQMYGCKSHKREGAKLFKCCMLWTERYGCKDHGVLPGHVMVHAVTK